VEYSVSIQYIEPGMGAPHRFYVVSHHDFLLPAGVPVPRTGEFIQVGRGDGFETYEVLSVVTRYTAKHDDVVLPHIVITVGPLHGTNKAMLSSIAE
jgi:hypothetical protein